MRLVGVDHVQLAIPPGGEALAGAFYGELLGLKETPKPAALAVRGGAWYESEAVKLHLGVEQEFRPAKKAHPALLVHGLTELLERARRLGVVFREAEPLGGRARVYLDDPFGNRLEFIESA